MNYLFECDYMHIEIYRNYFRPNYTIGKLFIDDEYFCDTLEPSYLGEYPCIPTGTYTLSLDVISPKYHNRFPYRTLCKGRVPRLLSVPHREGILIHIGNFPTDTKGCILIGYNTKVGSVLKSTNTFIAFYKKIKSSIYTTISIYNVPLDKLSTTYVPLSQNDSK